MNVSSTPHHKRITSSLMSFYNDQHVSSVDIFFIVGIYETNCNKTVRMGENISLY